MCNKYQCYQCKSAERRFYDDYDDDYDDKSDSLYLNRILANGDRH